MGLEEKEDLVFYLNASNKIEIVSDDPSNSIEDNHGFGQESKPINEETGEINWDCPCLKSALAPPCGEYFKEAFSCFVASKTEPKGADCLEKFSAMQDCFRANPEIYMKDDDDGGEPVDSDGRRSVDTEEKNIDK